ncbi:hypothetical Protein pso3_08360 [Candidatus Phytoplasma solani]
MNKQILSKTNHNQDSHYESLFLYPTPNTPHTHNHTTHGT